MARGNKFYLDKSNAKVWGVCAGIADFTGIDALWIRVAAVLLAFTTGFAILAYIAIAVLADSKPDYLDYDHADEDRMLRKWQAKRNRPRTRADRMRGELSDIDRRVSDIESVYSAKSARLAAEIDSLR